MHDIRSLKPVQLDALREVANIGAGHAATALSAMTGDTIMISVPTINIAPLEEVPPQLAEADEPVAAVLMNMMGDLTGRTLLVFPQATAIRLSELMLRRQAGSSKGLGELEQSVEAALRIAPRAAEDQLHVGTQPGRLAHPLDPRQQSRGVGKVVVVEGHQRAARADVDLGDIGLDRLVLDLDQLHEVRGGGGQGAEAVDHLGRQRFDLAQPSHSDVLSSRNL